MSEVRLRPPVQSAKGEPTVNRTQEARLRRRSLHSLLEGFGHGEEFVYGVPVAAGAGDFQGAFDGGPGHFRAAHAVGKIDEGFTADDPEFFRIGFYF